MKVFEDSSRISRWIQHIPKDWKLSRLANVSDIRFSNVDKHTVEDEAPVYLCNYVDVYKKDRITGEIDFMEASADAREIERFQILKNDVLVTKDSETADDIAISALVVDDLPGVLCGYHLALIRPRTHLAHGPYLAWLHACKSFRAYYEAKAVGVTRFGLSQAAFKQAPVPLPTLPEQRRIVAYLDKTCSAIDTAIDKKQKQLETLDALRKSIIHKAVTRGLDDSVELKDSGLEWLGDIPIAWKVTRLKDVARIRYGLGQPPQEKEDGIPMIRATNIDAGHIIEQGLLRVDPEALPLSRDPYLAENDIIVVRSGAYTGDSAIIPSKYAGAVAGYDMVVTAKKADPMFISYALLSSYVLNGQLLLMTLRAAQPHLNAEELGSILIVLPKTADEQQRIAMYVENKTGEIDEVRANLSAQIATLGQYRKSLIHECVTGKRRITEEDLRVVQQY